MVLFRGLMLIILIIVIAFVSVWYSQNRIETFQNTCKSSPALIGSPVPIPTQFNRSTSDLQLCDPENSNIRKNMKKGINIIYTNHVNNNIKKIIDDYVNIQLLTDRMDKMNDELILRLHKNKKYNTDGEMTFV